jgi:hypothetical protein
VTGREPVTATGTGAVGAVGVGVVGVGAGVVGVGAGVVGVAVGVFVQVHVGVGEAVPVSVDVAVAVDVDGCSLAGAASAECEANSTVKLVATSVMLASPAILARFVVFNAVTRCLLGCEEIGRADSEPQAACSSCHRAVVPWCPTLGQQSVMLSKDRQGAG